MNEKTKAVLINSPNNPSGKVFDEASIRGLAALLTEGGKKIGREIFLISDEPYSEIVYADSTPQRDAGLSPQLYRLSYSKSLSLPASGSAYRRKSAMEGLEEVVGGLTLCNRILGFVNALRSCSGRLSVSGGEGGRGGLPPQAGPFVRRTQVGRL